jgi:hypothetical protein
VLPAAGLHLRPTVGGFLVTVFGSNLLPMHTSVTIASDVTCSAGERLPCANVTVDTDTYSTATCVAPVGCGNGTLLVSVRGIEDGVDVETSWPFEYDGPVLTAVMNRTLDAALAVVVHVHGDNFGVNSANHGLPEVFIGTCRWLPSGFGCCGSSLSS